MSLSINYQQFYEWLNTDLGKFVLAKEKLALLKLLEESQFENILIVGYAELYLTTNLEYQNLDKLIKQFILIPFFTERDPLKKPQTEVIITTYEKLPIGNNAIDLIFLPHSLEIVSKPLLLLNEAYRVLRPEGKIIMNGFNLFSIWGGYKLLAKKFNLVPWGNNFYHASELFNWLELLGFSTFKISYCCYSLPINNRIILFLLNFFEKIFNFLPLIPGNVYTISASKKIIKLTAIFDKELEEVLDGDNLVKNILRN